MARRFGLRHSVYKLAQVARLVSKAHLYDAQARLDNVDKKASEIISKVINSARANGVAQGMAEERMFIKTIICGKGLLYKKLDIKGRGKMGIIRVPKCSVQVVLEEKPLLDFYKLMLQGKAPSGTAHLYRTILVQSDADFEQVQKLSFLTTSRGRHYRKTQFKRLVNLIEAEHKKKGLPMNREKIERNILEKTAQDWVDKTRNFENKALFSKRSVRQEMFDKNYKAK